MLEPPKQIIYARVEFVLRPRPSISDLIFVVVLEVRTCKIVYRKSLGYRHDGKVSTASFLAYSVKFQTVQDNVRILLFERLIGCSLYAS